MGSSSMGTTSIGQQKTVNARGDSRLRASRSDVFNIPVTTPPQEEWTGRTLGMSDPSPAGTVNAVLS